MHIKRRRRFFLGLAVVAAGALVLGCGQKGPLYLPEEEEEEEKEKQKQQSSRWRVRRVHA